MAFHLDLSSSSLDVSIKSDIEISILQDEVVTLVKSAAVLDTAVSCNSIVCKRKGNPALLEHEYKITVADGRVWTQILKFDEPSVRMTFDVPDFWKLQEFVAHRPLRDIISLMVPKFSIDNITITFST